jgi:hypothetical protein
LVRQSPGLEVVLSVLFRIMEMDWRVEQNVTFIIFWWRRKIYIASGGVVAADIFPSFPLFEIKRGDCDRQLVRSVIRLTKKEEASRRECRVAMPK